MSSADPRPPFAVPLPKKGTNADALFSLPPSLAVGSLYVDPHKLTRVAPVKLQEGRSLFKPAGVVHFSDPFPSLGGSPVAVSHNKKEMVIVRGVYVNRSNEPFEKFPEYAEDPVEDKTKREREALHKVKEKFKDLPPFRVSAPALAPFTKAKELYYSLLPRGGLPRERKAPQDKADAPVAAFKPAGVCPPLSKFPEHVADPPTVKTAVKTTAASTVAAWRPSDAALKSKPAPSVAFNVQNLRKEVRVLH